MLGERVDDWQQPLHSLRSHRGIHNPPFRVHYSLEQVELFLRDMLKIAVIKDKQTLANELDREVYLWRPHNASPSLPNLSTETGDDIDRIIGAFRRRCPVSLPAGDHTPRQESYLTLSHALYQRYTRFQQLEDLQEAITARSSVGHLGSSVFDTNLAASVHNNLDPKGVHLTTGKNPRSHRDGGCRGLTYYEFESSPGGEPQIYHFYLNPLGIKPCHQAGKPLPFSCPPNSLSFDDSEGPGAAGDESRLRRTITFSLSITWSPRAAEDALSAHYASRPRPRPTLQVFRRQLPCLKLAGTATYKFMTEGRRKYLEEALTCYQELVNGLENDDQSMPHGVGG